jgi:opine dehydrogenase
MKVSIIGCGHGGQALAADLSRRGCEVTLYAPANHPGGIHAIAAAGGIHCSGQINAFVPIAKVTCSIEDTLTDSQYIFITIPSFAYESVFMELLPHIKSGQTIVTLASNFASLIYLRLLMRMKKNKGINMIDVATLPYVCRADHQGKVKIIAIKKTVSAASIPSSSIHEQLSALSAIFPCQLEAFENVLSLGLNLINGLIHPSVTLFNAGRIGNGKKAFYFYRDGITPEIAGIIERLDEERMRIGSSFGFKMFRFLDTIEKYYERRYTSVYQFFCESPSHNALPLCPASLRERYIIQDVPGVLVPWYSLGKVMQIDSLPIHSVINLAGLLNHANYLRDGHNLSRLNLQDKSVEEIMQYINTGEVGQASHQVA